MIQKLIKSLRKFVCSKLKTYKRSRYLCIQPPPPLSPSNSNPTTNLECDSTSSTPDAECTTPTKRRHTIKEIREKKICFEPGDYTRNPFFNFLREYRRTHCGMTIVEQAVNAGVEWRRMKKQEKCKYYVQTDGKPRRRRRYKRRSIYWIKQSKIEV